MFPDSPAGSTICTAPLVRRPRRSAGAARSFFDSSPNLSSHSPHFTGAPLLGPISSDRARMTVSSRTRPDNVTVSAYSSPATVS